MGQVLNIVNILSLGFLLGVHLHSWLEPTLGARVDEIGFRTLQQTGHRCAW
jgi:hypothetical protein